MLNQSGRMPSGGTNPGIEGQTKRLGLGVGNFGGGGAGTQGGVGTAGGEIVGQGSGDRVGVGSCGGDGVTRHLGSGRRGSAGSARGVMVCGAGPTPGCRGGVGG